MNWKPYLEGVPRGDPGAADALQAEMKITLPKQYVEDLMLHAGDIPAENIVKLNDEEFLFGPLLYVGSDEEDEYYSYSVESVIVRIAEWYDTEEDVIAGLWPFGKDLSTGYYCFDFRDGAKALVVFINKQFDPDEDGAITPLADSYEAFIKSLT